MGATPTRERILNAAIAEFAQYGFSGARIDRIAEAAQANKKRIYAYFGDKGALFRRVMATPPRPMYGSPPPRKTSPERRASCSMPRSRIPRYCGC